jgi:hypothetical protein
MLAAALPAVACKGGSSSSAPPPAAGTERGACRPDRSCDRGLTCLSDLCVRPPAADCAKVGESLAYVLTDNYTPREERDGLRNDLTRQCQDGGFTADEGACLARATSPADIRACPRVLGLGDCKRITAHLDGLRSANGVDAYLVTSADRIISRCRSESPTLAVERCVLGARTIADVDRCAW